MPRGLALREQTRSYRPHFDLHEESGGVSCFSDWQGYAKKPFLGGKFLA
jgi:hypothetical protein